VTKKLLNLGEIVMQHKKLLSLAVTSALGLTASLMATGVAVAQEDQDENAEDMLEEVIVTGSRIATVDGFGRDYV
jgi:Na+/H+ antiporter NhaA